MATTKRPAGKRRAGAKGGRKTEPAISSAVARKALESATRSIRALLKDVRRNAYKIGKHLLRVDELELYRAKRYASLVEYADKECDLKSAAAYQYMRVAGAFSEQVCVAFGPEKLDRAMRYIAQSPAEEDIKDIPQLVFEVPREDGKGMRRKSFEDVTSKEIVVATAALKGDKPTPGGPLPPSLQKLLARLNAALDKAVGKSAASGAFIETRARAKDTVVDLSGIPLHLLKPALRAILVLL